MYESDSRCPVSKFKCPKGCARVKRGDLIINEHCPHRCPCVHTHPSPPPRKRFLIVPQSKMNSFPEGLGCGWDYRPGDMVLHLVSVKDHALRHG